MSQNIYLKQLNQDKNNIEENILNLNRLNDSSKNELSNLNLEFNKLNNQANEEKDILKNKKKENNDIKEELKKEKDINHNLFQEYVNKDNDLTDSKQQLRKAECMGLFL